MRTVDDVLRMAREHGVSVCLADDGRNLTLSAAAEPPEEVIVLVTGVKPRIVSRLQMERRMIDRWIRARIVDWPLEHCFGCRKRILVGQNWTDVKNESDAQARFHCECHPVWLAEQEILARKTIGLASA